MQTPVPTACLLHHVGVRALTTRTQGALMRLSLLLTRTATEDNSATPSTCQNQWEFRFVLFFKELPIP